MTTPDPVEEALKWADDVNRNIGHASNYPDSLTTLAREVRRLRDVNAWLVEELSIRTKQRDDARLAWEIEHDARLSASRPRSQRG